MHLKMAPDYTGFGKGAFAIPFLKKSTLFDRKMIQKMCSIPLYHMRPVIRTFDTQNLSIIRTNVVMRGTQYSSVLKYRNFITQNEKNQNLITRKLSQMQKFSWKSFSEFYVVYVNVCLKLLRPILRKMEIAND